MIKECKSGSDLYKRALLVAERLDKASAKLKGAITKDICSGVYTEGEKKVKKTCLNCEYRVKVHRYSIRCDFRRNMADNNGNFIGWVKKEVEG